MTTTLTPLPYVWEWQNKHRTRSEFPYRNMLLAKTDAEADYMREVGPSNELHWKPVEVMLPGVDTALELCKRGEPTGWIAYRRPVVMEISDAYEVPAELQPLFDKVAGKLYDGNKDLPGDLRTLLKRHDELVTQRERAEREASEDSDVISDLQELNTKLEDELTQLKQASGYGELAVLELRGKLEHAKADAAMWEARADTLHTALDNLQVTANRAAREMAVQYNALDNDVTSARQAMREATQ